MSYRFFRQQRTPVATGLTPVVGAELGLVAARFGRWSLAVENRGTVDLTPTRFVLEDQSVHRLSPLGLQTGLVVRFAGSPEQ